MLAALLLRANHVVPAEALWGTDLPPSARVSLQNYVARLRHALGPAGSRITTHPHGYLPCQDLRVPADVAASGRPGGILPLNSSPAPLSPPAWRRTRSWST